MTDDTKSKPREVKDLPGIKERVSSKIKENAERSNEEPNINLKNPKETKSNEPPMSMEGDPDIKDPKAKTKSIIFYYEDPQNPDGEKKTKEIELQRLTVDRREAVTLIWLKMMQAVGAIDERGVDYEKIDMNNIENAFIMSTYLRQMAPFMTDYPESFWRNVPFSELTKLLEWVMENETGMVKAAEDFLSMREMITEK